MLEFKLIKYKDTSDRTYAEYFELFNNEKAVRCKYERGFLSHNICNLECSCFKIVNFKVSCACDYIKQVYKYE